MLCTEDDNSCYRNVCKMSVVSFALAVVFIILHSCTKQLHYDVNITSRILVKIIHTVAGHIDDSE